MSIYYYKSKEAMKITRLLLLYNSVILLCAYNSVFSEITAPKEGAWHFNIYLIILSVIIKTPIKAIFGILVVDKSGEEDDEGEKVDYE